nr:bifunctional 3-phenylpropionate/cinnamic acid dioxygenase ferredoxin subunit [Rhodococcus sp. (in: high G+C Gram-positive bacteria)]
MTATFSTRTLLDAARVEELPDGEALRITPPGAAPIAIFNVDGEYFAIDDTCTHQDASLSEGWVEDCAVECPLHTACFDLRTGAALGAPAKIPVRTHAVLVEDGVIRVAVSP